tara:strand:- start:4513 stop:5094 length:582 start_codon:yes stop_codon:yes gene_type:complete
LFLAQTVNNTTKIVITKKEKKMAENTNFIKDSSQILLEGLRLSNNPDKTVVDDENGINGKLNVSEDGRKYYMAIFADPTNPLAPEKTRMVAQTTNSNGDPIWRAGRPEKMKKFVGKLIPGDFITRKVEMYEIGENEVEIYSCVVLKGENIETVFRQNGHDILSDNDGYTPDADVDTDDAPEILVAQPETTVTQ